MTPFHKALPFSPDPVRRALTRPPALWSIAVVTGLSLAAACGGKDDLDPSTLNANAGSAGARAEGGAAGAGDMAGPVGEAGTAMAGGAPGLAAGAAGSGSISVFQGTITVLNDDAEALQGPTTAAIRDRDLWIVNGQLAQLGGSPILPFNLVSVPLAGGPVGNLTVNFGADDFFPEGIAASSDGTLYIGSVTLGTILRVNPNSIIPDRDDFVAAGVALRGVIGIAVDEDRDAVWFCDSTPTGIAPGGDIVGVDIDTGLEIVRHEMPDPVVAGVDPEADAGAGAGDAGAPPGASTFCNDLIVAPDGDLFATDSSGRVFRVDAADAEEAVEASVWLESPAITVPNGFGANGIDQVGDRLIIASNGTLVAVDPESDDPASTVQVLSLSEDGAPASLCGPDGLQTVPGSTNQIVVIENGFCESQRERVVKVTLRLD
jgi:sugar lactone lactonase YvrE